MKIPAEAVDVLPGVLPLKKVHGNSQINSVEGKIKTVSKILEVTKDEFRRRKTKAIIRA